MIVTIDGTSGSGKGTISKLLAEKYNFATLDTGLLYRVSAYKALNSSNVDVNNEDQVAEIALNLTLEDISQAGNEVRTEEVSKTASIVARFAVCIMRSVSARPPKTWANAPNKTDLPAPVSPVIMVRP